MIGQNITTTSEKHRKYALLRPEHDLIWGGCVCFVVRSLSALISIPKTGESISRITPVTSLPVWWCKILTGCAQSHEPADSEPGLITQRQCQISLMLTQVQIPAASIQKSDGTRRAEAVVAAD